MCTIKMAYGILFWIVYSCNLTYSTVMILLPNRFAVQPAEAQSELRTMKLIVNCKFLTQVHRIPIQLTAAGLHVLDKSFMTSVSDN